MGWLDTPEDRRRQHVQVIAGGNIRDLDRIHERNRRRSINAIFWFLFIVSGLLGWLMFQTGLIKQSFYLFGFALLFLVIIIFRYGWNRKLRLPRRQGRSSRHGDWEKLREVPSWVPRKMKRRRSNHINGEHFRYKREGNVYYRKLK